MTSMVAFPMAVTERTQNRVISIFSNLAGKAAPRRPADFTGVFYAPEYPLDGLGSVSFLQISWIRPSGDVPVSLTQNPPCFTLHYMMALVRDFTIAIEAVDGGFDEAATAIAFLVEPHHACHTKSLEKGRVV